LQNQALPVSHLLQFCHIGFHCEFLKREESGNRVTQQAEASPGFVDSSVRPKKKGAS
jgi:hypothetical protein